MKLKTVVVDDEPIARKGIKSLVDKIEFLDFVAEAKDIEQLIQCLNETTVDVVFLDIEMPGLSGIDFVKTYNQKLPLIIFITAYHDFAVESYTLHAVDYLLKPVSFERFHDASQKALEIARAYKNLESNNSPFFIRHEGKYQKMDPTAITHIAALQNYIQVYSNDGKSLMIRSTLKEFQEHLMGGQFLMVHKSYIVNKTCIESISSSHVSIKDFGQIPVGRKYKEDVMKALLH